MRNRTVGTGKKMAVPVLPLPSKEGQKWGTRHWKNKHKVSDYYATESAEGAW